MESEVIDIREAAAKLGRTPTAMKALVHKKMNQGGKVDLPEPFMLLGRWVWDRQAFQSWLDAKKPATD